MCSISTAGEVMEDLMLALKLVSALRDGNLTHYRMMATSMLPPSPKEALDLVPLVDPYYPLTKQRMMHTK
jgi:hypothetical protein